MGILCSVYVAPALSFHRKRRKKEMRAFFLTHWWQTCPLPMKSFELKPYMCVSERVDMGWMSTGAEQSAGRTGAAEGSEVIHGAVYLLARPGPRPAGPLLHHHHHAGGLRARRCLIVTVPSHVP